ncbi:4a-hydroxytetrahydrobiopterin dehydratase [Nocardioides bruguierae]|uniref:Putative pterin-4-alpha-carbinolamine dehydratase n=1 Tax=Nocardioides bruguierae TaxID=2945102 RepID=A0A9X2D5J5_9ACTN|nr:4a-hydroxytetrahydrobiopterin dehydratase [Nocardioides bruguierae]MCL8026530.1 4a-hydroxytetrahydrobiopterin dehydratase [Nocardioides bruguierae]MCM0619736.1 4a-hydroxytetrahydrobiopterin dehydratase [Nocardioides bruguierae]
MSGAGEQPGATGHPVPEEREVWSTTQVDEAGLSGWRPLLGRLRVRYLTQDFATGAAFVAELARLADAADHHPDVDLRYGHVEVGLVSHDVGGLTVRDVMLAREVSELAAEMGVVAAPVSLRVLELALDTWDAEEVAPFWAAVLDGVLERVEHEDGVELQVVDPGGTLPTVWFQPCDRPRARSAPAQRWHADVRVPPEVVRERIDAALAAGGTMVSDEEAPAFWVLADPQGNQACLTTWHGRGE